MKLLKEDFNEILEKQRITPVFQPIFSLIDGEITGYEALSRIVEPQEIRSTEELFYLAGIYGKTWELEQLCRSRILKRYHELCAGKENKKIFLNVNPMVIHDNQFHMGFTSQYLKQYDLSREDVVFEVTERSAVDDMKGFKDTIRHYKSQGYGIAIDDAGSCYSGLNLICDIVPHYLKLDMALIHDVHKDAVKYAMVKALVEFANLTNIRLIAEGIETAEELQTLIKLGVHNGQGYFLRKPHEELKGLKKEAMEIIEKTKGKKETLVRMPEVGDGEFRAVLFKVDNYKSYRAYCRKYGDEKGDQFIAALKDVVVSNLSETETMAMLDADTMLAVLEKENYKMKCETILSTFRNKSAEFYTKEDWEKGVIEGANKRGEYKEYELIEICSERVV